MPRKRLHWTQRPENRAKVAAMAAQAAQTRYGAKRTQPKRTSQALSPISQGELERLAKIGIEADRARLQSELDALAALSKRWRGW